MGLIPVCINNHISCLPIHKFDYSLQLFQFLHSGPQLRGEQISEQETAPAIPTMVICKCMVIPFLASRYNKILGTVHRKHSISILSLVHTFIIFHFHFSTAPNHTLSNGPLTFVSNAQCDNTPGNTYSSWLTHYVTAKGSKLPDTDE